MSPTEVAWSRVPASQSALFLTTGLRNARDQRPPFEFSLEDLLQSRHEATARGDPFESFHFDPLLLQSQQIERVRFSASAGGRSGPRRNHELLAARDCRR